MNDAVTLKTLAAHPAAHAALGHLFGIDCDPEAGVANRFKLLPEYRRERFLLVRLCNLSTEYHNRNRKQSVQRALVAHLKKRSVPSAPRRT